MSWKGRIATAGGAAASAAAVLATVKRAARSVGTVANARKRLARSHTDDAPVLFLTPTAAARVLHEVTEVDMTCEAGTDEFTAAVAYKRRGGLGDGRVIVNCADDGDPMDDADDTATQVVGDFHTSYVHDGPTMSYRWRHAGHLYSVSVDDNAGVGRDGLATLVSAMTPVQ